MTRICDLSSKFKVSDIFVHGLIRYDLTFGDSCGFFAMAIGLSAELRFVQIRQRVWSLTNNGKLSRNFRTDPSIGSSLIQRPEPENERPSHSSLGLASLTVRLRPEKSLPANPLHRCMSFSGIVQRYKTEAQGSSSAPVRNQLHIIDRSNEANNSSSSASVVLKGRLPTKSFIIKDALCECQPP